MKITIIMADPAMSGGDRVCAIYAKLLAERGHRVEVIAPRKRLLPFKEQLKRLIKGGGWSSAREQRQNHFAMMGVEVTYLEATRPVTAADLPDADVVIATWWETAEWVAGLPDGKGAKVYFIQHHETHQGLPVDRVARTYRLPLRKITIARWLVDLMQHTYQDAAVALVPNSADLEVFHAPARTRQAVPTLGFLYSHVEFKGVDTALAVIDRVKSLIPDLRVLCFGNVRPGTILPIPEAFEFEYDPDQAHIREIYAQCDVWLCCSRSEGFGLTILEAMACRCPAVSTRCGGPEDIIQDGQNGYLRGIDDVEALADAVVRVLRSPDREWQAMSDAALARAAGYTGRTPRTSSSRRWRPLTPPGRCGGRSSGSRRRSSRRRSGPTAPRPARWRWWRRRCPRGSRWRCPDPGWWC